MKKSIFFLFFLFFASCSPATMFISPIVTGVILWKEGEAHKYYNDDIKVIYRSTKSALKDLGYEITKDESRKEGYYIVAGKEDRFKISILKTKPHITEVKIRVNFMGDKPYAELVYRQIDTNTDSIYFDEQGRPTKITRK